MEVVINGEQQKVSDSVTIAGLLEGMQLTGRRIAVEVNEEIVPRSEHPNYQLSPGDQIEIVHAIGGG